MIQKSDFLVERHSTALHHTETTSCIWKCVQIYYKASQQQTNKPKSFLCYISDDSFWISITRNFNDWNPPPPKFFYSLIWNVPRLDYIAYNFQCKLEG